MIISCVQQVVHTVSRIQSALCSSPAGLKEGIYVIHVLGRVYDDGTDNSEAYEIDVYDLVSA